MGKVLFYLFLSHFPSHEFERVQDIEITIEIGSNVSVNDTRKTSDDNL